VYLHFLHHVTLLLYVMRGLHGVWINVSVCRPMNCWPCKPSRPLRLFLWPGHLHHQRDLVEMKMRLGPDLVFPFYGDIILTINGDYDCFGS